MKGKIIASSLYLVIGFVLFAVVFIFGLIALLSVLFGSVRGYGTESINVSASQKIELIDTSFNSQRAGDGYACKRCCRSTAKSVTGADHESA